MAIGTSGAVLESLDTGFPLSVADLAAGLATYAELSTGHDHLLAFEDSGNKTKFFVHVVSFIPRHLESPPNAEMCNLCARNKTVPMCPKAHPL